MHIKFIFAVFFLFCNVMFVICENENDFAINVRVETSGMHSSCHTDHPQYNFTDKTIIIINVHRIIISNYPIKFGWLAIESKNTILTFNNVKGEDLTVPLDKRYMEGVWNFTFLHSKNVMPHLIPKHIEQNERVTCQTEVSINEQMPKDKEEKARYLADSTSVWIEHHWSQAAVVFLILAIIVISVETTLIIICFSKRTRDPTLNDRYNPLLKNVEDEDRHTDKERYCPDPAMYRKNIPEVIEENRESLYECPEIALAGLPPPSTSPPSVPNTPRPTHIDTLNRRPRTTFPDAPVKPSETRSNTVSGLCRPNNIEESIRSRAPFPIPTEEEVYEEADYDKDSPEDSPGPVPTPKPSLPQRNVPAPLFTNNTLPKKIPPNKPMVNEKPQKAIKPIEKSNVIPIAELNNAFKKRNTASSNMAKETIPSPVAGKPQLLPMNEPNKFQMPSLRPTTLNKPAFKPKPAVNAPVNQPTPVNRPQLAQQPTVAQQPSPAQVIPATLQPTQAHNSSSVNKPQVHNPHPGHIAPRLPTVQPVQPTQQQVNQSGFVNQPGSVHKPPPVKTPHNPEPINEAIYSNGDDGEELNPWNEEWEYEPITNLRR